MAYEEQLDLFAASGASCSPAAGIARPPGPVPAVLDDAALLAAIPAAGLADGPALVGEAGRRRLVSAIPVLEDYCRRFAGFGLQKALPEQVAAFEALATIGGAEAACCVATIISRCWVQGPTLAVAVNVAARLGSRLPPQNVVALLRHADPTVRADACRLARRGPDVIDVLVDLLGDLNRRVCIEAACALGRMAQAEALPALKLALRQAPTVRVIEAITPLADDECVVLLGRLVRDPAADLAAAAAEALDAVEHPLARRIRQRQAAR